MSPWLEVIKTERSQKHHKLWLDYIHGTDSLIMRDIQEFLEELCTRQPRNHKKWTCKISPITQPARMAQTEMQSSKVSLKHLSQQSPWPSFGQISGSWRFFFCNISPAWGGLPLAVNLYPHPHWAGKHCQEQKVNTVLLVPLSNLGS